MLSRVAERVYWMARYLERAENTARLLNVYSNLLLDLPRGTKVGWHSLVDISGVHDEFEATGHTPDERHVVKYLLSGPNGVSILSILSMVRENARTTREIIPSEAFEHINNMYLHTREHAANGLSRGPRNKLLEEIIVGCQQLTGLLAGTLSQNHVYRFIQLGRNLERADMTTRIVDVGSRNLLPDPTVGSSANDNPADLYQDMLWMSVLRSLSAYQMYRQHVQDRVNAEDVIMFLTQNKQFPRTVTHCLTQVKDRLGALLHNEKALAQINKAMKQAQKGKNPRLLSEGLFQYIDELQIEIAQIHTEIVDAWFLPRI